MKKAITFDTGKATIKPESTGEINRITKQFDQMRKMMRAMTGSKMNKMMANMPKGFRK